MVSEVEKKLEDLKESIGARGTVSMRELNQKTRSVIDHVVEGGTSLTVTDRGKPVAELHPVAQKTALDRLQELGVVSGHARRFEPDWEPIEGVQTTVEEFRDEEQDESWMDELMGRPSSSRHDGAVAYE